jgi:hypothetical protein
LFSVARSHNVLKSCWVNNSLALIVRS